ncbi:methylmalonyl-CoA mutase [Longibacter salinarum]|uniref:Methylmalonyl-CoA mutase n=1 Tax=Longibacter salinarum TaxID=1850348 RepID=A0A2A8D2L6_9BACT|nr:methylmalonyl-CoA mutase family protein [Longibacter salinarum]PEN15114.1 methylmalonyl-CoA mutase [Longibacter salinarum]
MSTSLDDRSDVGTAQDLSFTKDFAPIPTQEWEERIRSDMRGKPLHRLNWVSVDGITLRPFYRQDDLRDFEHLADDPVALVQPAADEDEASASHPSAGNKWSIRQDITDADPSDAAQRIAAAVQGGADEIGLPLFAPPLLDSSAHMNRGIHVAGREDLSMLLDSIDLSQTGVHLAGGPVAAVLLPELMDQATSDGQPSELRGSVGFDPGGSLATGSITDPTVAFGLAAESVETGIEMRNMRTIMVDARPYHNAGASAVQELAFTLGALTETLDQLTERGVSADTAVDRLHFALPIDTSYFVEIGKLRALRFLATRVVNAFLDQSESNRTVQAADLFVQAHTSRRTQTVYGAYVNMLRGTTQAASAIIGGCDVLTVAPFDESLNGPNDFASRIARNTQLILRHESHLDQVADPGAGSYYVEAVTNAIIEEAWPLFQAIEKAGGMLEALASGTIAEQIAEVREKRRERVDQRKHVLVGTTHYPDVDEQHLSDVNKANHAIPDGLASAPDEGHGPEEHSPKAVPAVSGDDILEPIVEAMNNGASLRDVSAALAATPVGGGPGIRALPSIRLSEPFEQLRLRVEAYAERTGRTPTVLLAPYGPAGARSARANFARNYLGVAGFRIVEPISFDTADGAASAAIDDGADIVVACSSDDAYSDYVPALREALDEGESRSLLIVAGAPDGVSDNVRPAADHFVHLKAPLLDTLRSILRDLGIDATV